MRADNSLVEVIEAVALQYDGILSKITPPGNGASAQIEFNFRNKGDAENFLSCDFSTHFETSRDFTCYSIKLQPPEQLPYYAAVALRVIKEFPEFLGNIAFLPHSSNYCGNFVVVTPISNDSLAHDFIEKSGYPSKL